MKIILYGLGRGLDFIESNIKNTHEVVGYMDSYSNLMIFRGRPFYSLKDIHKIEYDYIIITVLGKRAAWNIYNMLVQDYELPCEYVIPFYVYANYEIHSQKLRTYNLEKIQGLIFGNSYAAYGLLEDELVVPFMNFAVPAQDIYYNFQIFKKCIFDYGDYLKNVQYVIIDIYKYDWFNYDTSMTKNIITYICQGGVLEEHNFSENPNYNRTLREELLEKTYMPEKAFLLKEFFDNICVGNDLGALGRWCHIKKDIAVEMPILKRHWSTVQENLVLINAFIEQIRKWNSKINIIFTRLPVYGTLQSLIDQYAAKWEEEFQGLICGLCKKYHIVFLDYHNRKDISENPGLYGDIEYLNTIGARAVTSLLNDDLIKNV